MAIIDYRVEDGVAILTWDDKDRPMNVLSGDALAELSAGVEKAVADDAVKGIILTSGKQGVFVAGGDLQQIESLGSGPIDAADLLRRSSAVLDQLRRMETCGKPVVAALNGVTLGGGYEIALACHRRILVNQRHAQVGLPEAGLGLMPGAGGTQRLPRLVGIQSALGLIMQGKQLAPDKALEQGLVDELVEPKDLISAAKKWINEDGNATQRWDEKRYKVPGGGADSVTFAQTMMGSNALTHANTYGNMPSQQAILQSVYDGFGLPMDRAGKVETRQFIRVLQDPTARAMLRTLFFSLQECQKGARRPKDVPRFDVKKVGIIGAGLMGQGIAHVSAKAKIDVVLLDRDLASAQRGKDKVAKTLDRRLQIVGQGLIGQILVVEVGVAAAVHRQFERVEHAAGGRDFDVGIVAVPHHLVAAEARIRLCRIAVLVEIVNRRDLGIVRELMAVLLLAAAQVISARAADLDAAEYLRRLDELRIGDLLAAENQDQVIAPGLA